MFKFYLQPSPKLLQVNLRQSILSCAPIERASSVVNFRVLLMCFSLFFIGVSQLESFLLFMKPSSRQVIPNFC